MRRSFPSRRDEGFGDPGSFIYSGTQGQKIKEKGKPRRLKPLVAAEKKASPGV